jgi:heme exporter protein A
VIEIRQLTKHFGPRVVLKDVNVHVDAGEFVVLAGPNGAGKTTLLRILARLTRPTSGTVQVAGLDLARDATELRRKIGFLSHRTLLYENLTAQQNLAFYARLYSLAHAQRRIDALLARVGLAARRDDLVRSFSRGMKQRLAIARAVLHRPTLLLLDEPYTGLDPLAVETLDALLQSMIAEQCTVLMTTHQITEEMLGARALILHQGQILDDTSLHDHAAFLKRYRTHVSRATKPVP